MIATVVAVLAVVAAVAFLGLRDGSGDAEPGAAPVAATSEAPAPPTGPPTEPPAEQPVEPAPVEPANPVLPDATVGSCTYTSDPAGPSRPVTTPTEADLRTGTVTADVATSVGELTFSLDGAAAPCAVASFVSLARQGFYDDTVCHRLVTDPSGPALLQCGDPSTTAPGTGGPGYAYAEEALDGATYDRGTIALAKTAAPASTGSQFFLVIGDVPLPPEYTPVGRVTQGLEALDPVAAAGSEPPGDGAPLTEVRLTTVTTSG